MTYALMIVWTLGAHLYADTIDHGLSALDCAIIAEAMTPMLEPDEHLECVEERAA